MTAQFIKSAGDLAAYARTCRMANNLAWMDGLAEKLNQFYAAVGDPLRVDAVGKGIESVEPIGGSRLQKTFHPVPDEE